VWMDKITIVSNWWIIESKKLPSSVKIEYQNSKMKDIEIYIYIP